MDRFNLRIIANPYLMKKTVNFKNNIQTERDNNELLYRYLHAKYKETYIHPVLYYNIINVIEETVRDHELTMVVDEIINEIINETVRANN